MGYLANPAGIDVFEHADNGDITRQFRATHAIFTTRRQDVKLEPDSSTDWLHQIYVADSEAGLLALLSQELMDVDLGPGTSGFSRQVTVATARGNAISVETVHTVIAKGNPIRAADPNKQLFLTTELHISRVAIGLGHPLRPLLEQQKPTVPI